MSVAVNIDVKSACLEGVILRVCQLRSVGNGPFVIGSFVERNNIGTVLASRRLVNMRTGTFYIRGHDFALDGFVILYSYSAMAGRGSLDRGHFLIAGQVHGNVGSGCCGGTKS